MQLSSATLFDPLTHIFETHSQFVTVADSDNPADITRVIFSDLT